MKLTNKQLYQLEIQRLTTKETNLEQLLKQSIDYIKRSKEEKNESFRLLG